MEPVSSKVESNCFTFSVACFASLKYIYSWASSCSLSLLGSIVWVRLCPHTICSISIALFEVPWLLIMTSLDWSVEPILCLMVVSMWPLSVSTVVSFIAIWWVLPPSLDWTCLLLCNIILGCFRLRVSTKLAAYMYHCRSLLGKLPDSWLFWSNGLYSCLPLLVSTITLLPSPDMWILEFSLPR